MNALESIILFFLIPNCLLRMLQFSTSCTEVSFGFMDCSLRSRGTRERILILFRQQESRFFGLQIGRPSKFLQGLWASFLCPLGTKPGKVMFWRFSLCSTYCGFLGTGFHSDGNECY